AGPHDAVAGFQAQLEAEGVACRLLRTSHAFHSAMMDAVVPRFRMEVEALARGAPTIPIVSTATGDWLTDEQATSAGYWAQHLRLPVRFSGAIARLLERREHVLLEVGPRSTLATLARQQPLLQKQRITALASLADAPEREHAALVAAFGHAWAAGLPLLPESLDRRERKARLRLPTYPFERKRYWVDVGAGQPRIVAEARVDPAQVPAVGGDMAATAATAAAAAPLAPAAEVPATVDALASILELQLQLMSRQLAALSACADDEDAEVEVSQQ